MTPHPNIFNRAEMLLGMEAMEQLARARVIIFGVGGVGSWCAESLVRTGIGHLTIVDSDRVAPSNVNRQAMATTATIGQVKVEALRQRLLEINPEADIRAIQGIYSNDSSSEFKLESYDYIVDAIDSLQHKATLILNATSLPRHTGFVSSMGAALKLDPTKIAVSEFWQVKGCPLARALRTRFKRDKTFPKRKFFTVYSPEIVQNQTASTPSECNAQAEDNKNLDTWTSKKAQVNGSLAHITAIFGFTMAGLVIKDLCYKKKEVLDLAIQEKDVPLQQ
ncbi:MAG: tRNA threonylcarbamoyladenosine dehydratase [Bacteroidaceae bacterium]|nr:tRNA threonylcarbamoyladenosine dehydratase [Bacteroidaceae bacterium]